MPNNDSLFENIYSAFLSAVEKYRLVEAGDRVAVCVSGEHARDASPPRY
mgnify:CR=1 FL=1